MMLGYLGNPKDGAATFDSEGWLRTGDIGYCNHGKWYIVDRKKVCSSTTKGGLCDLLKFSGTNQSPRLASCACRARSRPSYPSPNRGCCRHWSPTFRRYR